MRKILYLPLWVLIVICVACGKKGPGANHINMQKQVDSLKAELTNTYKPGFGEFMAGIQVHHNKLWFAGKAANWELAAFETAEMKEALAAIEKYCKDRLESKNVSMLKPAMDNVDQAIKLKSIDGFNKSYQVLTNTCNNCHQANKFGFNKIKVPAQPPFSNQEF